jgi:hypothetical protein
MLRILTDHGVVVVVVMVFIVIDVVVVDEQRTTKESLGTRTMLGATARH